MVIILIVVEDSKAWSGWHGDNPITSNISLRIDSDVKIDTIDEGKDAMPLWAIPVEVYTPFVEVTMLISQQEGYPLTQMEQPRVYHQSVVIK